jgi:anti-anti-sigma factor
MHRVRVEPHDGAVVVSAAGELDAFAEPDLSTALDEARGSGRVVVDLCSAAFLDSVVLGLVARVSRELEEAGVLARVVLPQGPARRIFEITALDKALPVSVTLESALDELGR